MDFKQAYKLILSEIETGCAHIDAEAAAALTKEIISAEKVFLIGVGRVLLSLEAFCKRLNHLGIQTVCVGMLDEPACTPKDLLIVGSGSGETAIPLAIAKIAKKHGARVAHIGSNPQSSIKEFTDVFVRIPVKTKLNLPDEIQSDQIMSSMFEQTLYVLCDSICMMIADQKHLMIHELWQYHANLE